MKVKSTANVKTLAGSITKALEDGHDLEITVIGAGALNQAYKALAKARGNVATKGRDLVVRPGFGNVNIDGDDKTTLKAIVSLD